MAAKPNITVGLDIGTSNIKVVLGEAHSGGKVDIIGVGTHPSRGLRKGVVINIEQTVKSISAAIDQAEKMAGAEIGSIVTAISGSHIKGFNSHGIVGIRNREVSKQDVEKVIDAARAVAIPQDREFLHVLPQEFIIDEQDGIREPLGISGVRLEAKVHIITGSVASAQNVVKCANRCGLSVSDIVLSGLASGKAVLSPEEQELGVCLVDVGGGTTDLIVYQGGAIKHSAVLPVGGNHITSDIAAGLRTPIDGAEEIKSKYGTALLSMVSEADTIEVPSTGGREPRVLSKSVLAEIIEPRVVELLNLVQKEIFRAECEDLLTSGMVLTGGTANLCGIREVAEEVFNIPVRVGPPTGVGGLIDLVSNPEYATAVGLVVHGAQSLSPSIYLSGRHSFSKTFKRVANWLGDHF